MPTDDPAIEVAKEVAKQLPVKNIYDDLMKKPCAQLSGIAEDLLRTIRLGLLSVQAPIQDRCIRFIRRAVESVPVEDRILPPPQILGPTLEGIRYEPEGTPIEDMFEQLLASSMNSESMHFVHPAFPSIIRQLCPDEAKILKLLSVRDYDHVYTGDIITGTNKWGNKVVVFDDFPINDLEFPQNFAFDIDHLFEMGLAAYFKESSDPIFSDTSAPGRQTGFRERQRLGLKPLGVHFASACIRKVDSSSPRRSD